MEFSTLKNKMFQSSLAGIMRVGLAIPLYIVLTPFILNKLGTELFGIWSFSTIIVSIITLTDFGFKNSLVHYVAKEMHRKDEINKHFNVAYFSYAIMVLIILVTIIFLRNFIADNILRVSEKFHNEAIFVLIITVLSFGIRFIAASYQAVIEGFQEIFYSQLVFLVWLFLNFIFTIIALLVMPNIYVLCIVNLCCNLVVFSFFYFRVKKCFPFIKVDLKEIEPSKIILMLKYGMGLHVATLVIALREPVYKILISRTYELSDVATFEIVYRLCTQLVSVVMAPLMTVFAASSMLSGKQVELGNVLRPLFGFAVSIFLPAVLFVQLFSVVLVGFWLGPAATNVGQMLPLMFAAFAIYYSTETLYKAIEGSGGSKYSAVVQLGGFLVNICVFFLLSANQKLSVPISLFSGFLVFSISNYFAFKIRFKNILLMRTSQVMWLLFPASIYLLVGHFCSEELKPYFFLVYCFVHLFAVRHAKLFDFLNVTKKILSFRRAVS